MAKYWVISSFLIGVISLNITPWNCVITKKSPKFVYNNVVRGAAVMFYRFIAAAASSASEFLKTQLCPLASRPALISSERFYPASVYNIRPHFALLSFSQLELVVEYGCSGHTHAV